MTQKRSRAPKPALADAPRVTQRALLAWYDRHRRKLPWRALPGEGSDPYAVWLSEIMLQQTTVTAVKPYYEKFLGRWPTVHDLARAAVEDVMTAWAGLGYYARARNLHACAKTVSKDYGGVFPDTEEGLLELPGVGPYTAAAIAAIAFGKRAVVVDGNVERVMARVFAVTEPLPGVKPKLKDLADSLTPKKRAGDYAQAVMDLGATVCTPKSPACVICPWNKECEGRKRGIAETLPRKAKKAATPIRHGVAFWLERADGAVLLRRRPTKGLLGGMMEIPSTAWRTAKWSAEEATPHAPVSDIAGNRWEPLDGLVGHTFTHFHLELTVLAARLSAKQAAAVEGVWEKADRLETQGLPTVMKKVALHALKSRG